MTNNRLKTLSAPSSNTANERKKTSVQPIGHNNMLHAAILVKC